MGVGLGFRVRVRVRVGGGVPLAPLRHVEDAAEAELAAATWLGLRLG